MMRELIWHKSIIHKALKDGNLFIYFLEIDSVSLLLFSLKQGKYWYYFYNAFWYDAVLDWGSKHSKPDLYH